MKSKPFVEMLPLFLFPSRGIFGRSYNEPGYQDTKKLEDSFKSSAPELIRKYKQKVREGRYNNLVQKRVKPHEHNNNWKKSKNK